MRLTEGWEIDVKRAIISALVVFSLAACNDTPPYQSAYFELPTARANKLTASVGEPVEVTVTAGFGLNDTYPEETFTRTGVHLGACISYTSDVAIEGGLCARGERPLPDGLSLVGDASFAADLGDVTLRRGEPRRVEHTFAFTSDRAGVFRLVPVFLFGYEDGADPQYEPGPYGILQITFE